MNARHRASKYRRLRPLAVALALLALSTLHARAQSSVVTQNGIDRAQAVTINCVAPGTNIAVPCGTTANPLVVTGGGSAGNSSASATNQQTQITAEQATANATGTQGDTTYTGAGATTLVGALKGLFAELGGTLTVNQATALPGGTNMIGQVSPIAAPLVSRTITVVGGQSTTLFAPNMLRHYLSFQAPQSTGIWVNRIGGAATPNGADCAYFSPGALFESGNYVNNGAVTVYSPNAATISAWEG